MGIPILDTRPGVDPSQRYKAAGGTGDSGGEFVTRPLRFSGSELFLNYSTSAAGSIRIEIQDEDGQPIPGFTLEESPVLFGDHIERPVKWQRPGTSITDPMRLDRLAEKPVRLRFVLKDADLYSLRFK